MDSNCILLDNCNIFAINQDWLLVPSNIELKNGGFLQVFRNSQYSLYIKDSVNKIPNDFKAFHDSTSFVFGNISKRLENSTLSPFDFKGHFIIIRFTPEKVIISNDHFGINKFFFTCETFFIASSKLMYLTLYLNDKTSDKTSKMLYLLYNYFVWGSTIFNSVRYSTPATTIEIASGKIIRKYQYWGEFEPKERLDSVKTCSEIISDYWVQILDGYSENQNGITTSLTGGFDCRMILAGLLKKSRKISSFTFGNRGSNDAINAKLISNFFLLEHNVFQLSRNSKQKFLETARKAVATSSGLLNILRILRLEYFSKATDTGKDLYLGYSGSEILRGLYPDGLMSTQFYLGLFKDPIAIATHIYKYLEQFHFKFTTEDIERLIEVINKNSDFTSHFQHLMKVIIPMHFGEDISWLNQKSIITRVPYIDVDFLEKVVDLGCVPLLKKSEKRIRRSHFSRIDNPKLSARVIYILNKRLGRLILGKGYSPADYIKSKYFAGFKLIAKKYFSTPELVTEYDSWYPEFLEIFLNDTSVNIDGFNKEKVIKSISKASSSSEIDYLVPTKYLNLFLINQEFNT